MSIERGSAKSPDNLSPKANHSFLPPEINSLEHFWTESFSDLEKKASGSGEPTESLTSQYFETISGLPQLRDLVAQFERENKEEDFSIADGWSRHARFYSPGRREGTDVFTLRLDKTDDPFSYVNIIYSKGMGDEKMHMDSKVPLQVGDVKQELNIDFCSRGSLKDKDTFGVTFNASRKVNDELTIIRSESSTYNGLSTNNLTFGKQQV